MRHDLLAMRESVEQVTVHEDVLHYVVSLATATRHHPQVAVGASPRAELDLVQLARARALLLGRDYVIPEDVKALAVPAVAHRITLRPEMWVRKIQGADVVGELLRRLPVPRTGGATGVPDESGCDRVREVEFRWRASPLARAIATCAGVALAAAGDRRALAADRLRGAAARRAVLDQLATARCRRSTCTASPIRSDASKTSGRG